MATPKLEINGTDVSSYVVRIDKVPINDNNRNLEPIASGFTCEISDAYTTTISVNQKVEFFLDSTAHFRGYVAQNKYDYNRKVKVITVHHILMLLDYKYVDAPTLQSLINNTADFTSAKTISSINTTTNYFTSTAHGFSNGDVIQLKSTGSLPDFSGGTLTENFYYYIINKTTDTFQLSFTSGGSAIDVTTTGSGTITCAEADLTKYNSIDSAGYSNLSISWLTEKLFEIAGMSIDSSAVDSTVKYSTTFGGSPYNFNWTQLLLDANMMYAINQPYAAYVSLFGDTPDKRDDYLVNRLKCLELLQFLIGKLGFRIKYTGSDTFTITNWSNTVYSLSSDYKLNYDTFTDYGENNTAHGAESFSDARSEYASLATLSTLDEGYTDFDGTSGNYNQVKWYSNLKILLRSTAGGGNVETGALSPANYWRIDQASTHSINAIENDWTVEEIEAPIQASNVNVKSEFIDVKNRRSIIVQETMS